MLLYFSQRTSPCWTTWESQSFLASPPLPSFLHLPSSTFFPCSFINQQLPRILKTILSSFFTVKKKSALCYFYLIYYINSVHTLARISLKRVRIAFFPNITWGELHPTFLKTLSACIQLASNLHCAHFELIYYLWACFVCRVINFLEASQEAAHLLLKPTKKSD